MGIPRHPEKAMLFVGALFSREDCYLEAYRALQQTFGEVIMETPPVAWNYSDHYEEEMSGPLFRRFIFFRNMIEPDALSRVKLATNELELNLATDGKRNINLDPGYLTLAKIILASTKDYSHRIYLKEGIYAETTLIFSKAVGKFVPNINTYNDYKDEKNLRFFLLARELFFLINK
jgi:hypothetical protein